MYPAICIIDFGFEEACIAAKNASIDWKRQNVSDLKTSDKKQNIKNKILKKYKKFLRQKIFRQGGKSRALDDLIQCEQTVAHIDWKSHHLVVE